MTIYQPGLQTVAKFGCFNGDLLVSLRGHLNRLIRDASQGQRQRCAPSLAASSGDDGGRWAHGVAAVPEAAHKAGQRKEEELRAALQAALDWRCDSSTESNFL